MKKTWVKCLIAVVVIVCLCIGFLCLGVVKDDEEVATVNGKVVTAELYRYFLLNAAMTEVQRLNPQAQNLDVKSIDWKQKDENGKTLIETIRDKAISDATESFVLIEEAEAKGFKAEQVSDDEVNSQIDEMISAYGEDMVLLNANAMGSKSIDAYKRLYKHMSTGQQFFSDINKNKDNYKDDFAAITSTENSTGATVKHILIKNETEKTDDPEKLANEICERAKNGEDFDALVAEYNEDPGATEEGYTFGPGEMVAEFETASFALGFDEISDVVKTSYGYHIIKRFKGAYDLLKVWKDKADVKVKKNKIKKINIEVLLSDAIAAQQKLSAIQQQAQQQAPADASDAEVPADAVPAE